MCAYIYSGCDQIGKFNSVSKSRAVNIYLECPIDVIDNIQGLGENFSNISENAIHAATQYTMLL